jgi:hypothetical protein
MIKILNRYKTIHRIAAPQRRNFSTKGQVEPAMVGQLAKQYYGLDYAEDIE